MTRTLLRRAVLAGAATTALLAAAACGHDQAGSGHDRAAGGHGSAASAPAATGSAAAGAVFNDADVAFAQHMIVHHRQAVEMADLAPTRAANAQVKDLAAKIKAAQDPEIATMNGWLTRWGRPPADGGHGSGHESMPGMMSEADMTKLAAATGAAFDRQFLTMMIAHHEGAITMAGEHAGRGSAPEAKALAGTIAADQRAEIATMRDMLAAV